MDYIPSWSGALGDANREAIRYIGEAPWGHTLRYGSFAQFAHPFFSLPKRHYLGVGNFYPYPGKYQAGTHDIYAHRGGPHLAT